VGSPPRLRGALSDASSSVHTPGSPPRLRGAPIIGRVGIDQTGITPAPAGSTEGMGCIALAVRDHPRACGEHQMNASVLWPITGSPPRLRGARCLTAQKRQWSGITPAPAGSTPHLSPALPRGRDHPRACGEHTISPPRTGQNRGSPPRLRGAPPPALPYLVYYGITPAPAGSTSLSLACPLALADHPRACGEHLSKTFINSDNVGSPPRLRGAQFCRLVSYD